VDLCKTKLALFNKR